MLRIGSVFGRAIETSRHLIFSTRYEVTDWRLHGILGAALSPGEVGPIMETFVKATALALGVLLTSSFQALAHSGHVPVAGSLHAVEHSAGGWLFVAMALVMVGAGAMITARVTRRDR